MLTVHCSASEPLHALIVLNRLGPRNVEVDITASSSVKVSPPFLMVRSAKDGTTYGFWFHDEDERVALEEALQRCVLDRLPGRCRAACVFPGDVGLCRRHGALRVRNGSSGAEMAPAVASLLGHGGAQAASGVPVEGEIDEASGRSLMQLLGLTVGGGAALASGSPARSPIPGAAGTASSATAPAAAASSVVSPPGGGGEEAATTVAGDGTPRGRTVVAAASGGGGGAGAGPLMLTKRQLQAMLIKLVQDDKFVDILHRQYMATVQRSRGQSPRS